MSGYLRLWALTTGLTLLALGVAAWVPWELVRWPHGEALSVVAGLWLSVWGLHRLRQCSSESPQKGTWEETP